MSRPITNPEMHYNNWYRVEVYDQSKHEHAVLCFADTPEQAKDCALIWIKENQIKPKRLTITHRGKYDRARTLFRKGMYIMPQGHVLALTRGESKVGFIPNHLN